MRGNRGVSGIENSRFRLLSSTFKCPKCQNLLVCACSTFQYWELDSLILYCAPPPVSITDGHDVQRKTPACPTPFGVKWMWLPLPLVPNWRGKQKNGAAYKITMLISFDNLDFKTVTRWRQYAKMAKICQNGVQVVQSCLFKVIIVLRQYGVYLVFSFTVHYI